MSQRFRLLLYGVGVGAVAFGLLDERSLTAIQDVLNLASLLVSQPPVPPVKELIGGYPLF
jgi:hypothetical protein